VSKKKVLIITIIVVLVGFGVVFFFAYGVYGGPQIRWGADVMNFEEFKEKVSEDTELESMIPKESEKEQTDEIRLFLKEGVTEEEVSNLQRYLSGIEGVEGVKYVSEEDVFSEFKELYTDQPELVEEIKENPFTAEFKVQVSGEEDAEIMFEQLQDRPEISPYRTGRKEIKSPVDNNWFNDYQFEMTIKRWLAIGIYWVVVIVLLILGYRFARKRGLL